MIPELGQLCLVLALLASMLQGAMPWVQRRMAPHGVVYLVKPLATVVFMLISTAFAALILCYIRSDFSVLNVVLNSHTDKPMLYKIVGAWGNHEGSMLLWMWVLAAMGFLLAYLGARDVELKRMTLAVLGMISAGFLAFILFTSNPFLRVFPPAPQGEDLNPILQDIGLAFHPPTLYIGYVGFGVVFAYAIAGLLLKRIHADWAREVQPWILLPWGFLTLGIGAGSWWAYRELGWGGWWFWDPVENVSLLPWLVGTALLHSNLVLERRGQLGGWVVLLAILAFTLSLIGTFIVRSGLITSVHAFASDPLRGLFILAYIGVVSGAALLVYGFSTLPKTGAPRLLSRSGFILLNNLLLVAAAALILVAILYPLMLELFKLPTISVGPPYFNATFLPMTAGLPILAALAPLMAWDRTSPTQLKALVLNLVPAVLVAAMIALALTSTRSLLMVIGLMLSLLLLAGVLQYVRRVSHAQVQWFSLVGMRHAASAMAHLGLAVFVIGMTATALLKQTYEAPLDLRAPIVLGDYTLTVRGAERITQDNYITRRATFDVARGTTTITTLTPELRYYPVRGMQTSEAALHSTPLRDLYLVLGEASYGTDKAAAALGVRLYVMPAQQWIWAGFMLTAGGGFLALLTALLKRRGL